MRCCDLGNVKGNDYFILDKCQICLYGYNKNAINISRNLKEIGLTVKYIVDQKAAEISETKVIDFALFEKKVGNKGNEWCIIICLQNGRIHDEIAMQFHQIGIDNLIYIPMSEKYSIHELNKIRQTYMEVLYGGIQVDKDIPTYGRLIKNRDIIKIIGKNVVLYAPIELVHVGKSEFVDLDVQVGHGLKRFFDKKIADFKLYNDLYNYIFEQGEFPQEYLDNCARNKNKDEYIKDRIALYRLMKYKVYNDPYFFIYSPALAKWNENGYFNLIDGHHRVNFLYNIGYVRIPIIITQMDYGLYEQYYHNHANGRNNM